MAGRTMEELLQAPTEGYGEAIVIPKILAENFVIKTNLLQLEETFGEALERFKEMLKACPHHRFSELTQIDTFYNGLNEQDQDSLNATAGGNLLSKMTREALKIIENKSKVRYSRSKSNVSRVNTNSRDSASKIDNRIDKLADQILNLVDIVNKQVITPATAKAVEITCVIYGGAHVYYDCIATDSNQPSVCAATGTLPSNTVPNPNGEMKSVTTRSGLAYEGPSIPTNLLLRRERFSEIKHAFIDKQYQPEEIQELMCKLLEDVQIIREEMAEYINSPSWNYPTFYDNDEELSIQHKEYLESFSNAIAPVLPTKEPEYCLSMRDEHLSTITETKSDEVIESSVKNLVQIPSEYEVTSDDKSECDVPVKDESSPVFTTFSNPLFDCNDDFTSSDDESLSNEDVPMEDFKVYSNPLSLSNHDTLFDSSPKFNYLEVFSGELMPTNIIDEERIKIEHEEYISLMEKLLSINSFPRPEEIDIFTGTDDLLPPSIESDDYDLEGDIHFLEELLSNDSLLLPENESSNFDHQDDQLFPRPPPKPPDVEFFFDLEPNSGEVISAVINNIDELNEDECFDLGGEIDVFANIEDDDYFPFIFVIRIFLPYIVYPEVSPLLLFAGSEDTIFYSGIST
nr:reverse transcriptase domain-containing protein [Tanacetum cinerariifolium]